MIVPKQEILELVGESDSFNLDFVHRSVEAEVKAHIDWDPEETTYYNMTLDSIGGQHLYLPAKNITTIARIATDKQAAISVKHTTAAANAYVRVVYASHAATTLGLNVDGSAETTKALATYTTMALLVAQITGSGWSAEIYDSDYNSFASTNLLEVDNVNCGTWDGTDPGWSYLYMPGKPISGYQVERTEGGVYRAGGWPDAPQSVIATFTAGWSTANMPRDLKQAVYMAVQAIWKKKDQDGFGVSQYTTGDISVKFMTETPPEAMKILDDKYRRKGL